MVVVLFNRQDIFLRQKVVKFLSVPLATFPKNIESFPQKVRSVEMKGLLRFPRQQLLHCRVFEARRFTTNNFNLSSNLKFQMRYFSPLERRRAGYCELVEDSLERVSCAGRSILQSQRQTVAHSHVD